MNAPTTPPPTREQIDGLLAFLPVFQKATQSFVSNWNTTDGNGNLIAFPYPAYTPEVEQFFQLAADPCWTDYKYLTNNAKSLIDDPARIQGASLDELKTMLTYCVRGERFCDGHWGNMLEKGIVTALLERLGVLRRSLYPMPNLVMSQKVFHAGGEGEGFQVNQLTNSDAATWYVQTWSGITFDENDKETVSGWTRRYETFEAFWEAFTQNENWFNNLLVSVRPDQVAFINDRLNKLKPRSKKEKAGIERWKNYLLGKRF